MIIHERTRTSRAALEIERDLSNKLIRLARIIRSDKNFPHNIPLLQQEYGAAVTNTIQKAVQQTYMAGVDYVSEFEDIPALLSAQDIQNIQIKTREQAEGFWRTITRDALNNQVSGLAKAVNIPAMAGLFATAATFGALSFATVAKTKELGDNAEVVWITALDELVCPICRPLHGKRWRINDPSLLSPVTSSHPNCRCRLLLKDGRQTYSH